MKDNYGIKVLWYRLCEINEQIDKMILRWKLDDLYDNQDFQRLQEQKAEIMQVIFKFSGSEPLEEKKPISITYKRNSQPINEAKGIVVAETAFGILLRSEKYHEKYIRSNEIITIDHE